MKKKIPDPVFEYIKTAKEQSEKQMEEIKRQAQAAAEATTNNFNQRVSDVFVGMGVDPAAGEQFEINWDTKHIITAVPPDVN